MGGKGLIEASAELIIIESDQYAGTEDGEHTTFTCHIQFHGRWAPVMEWTIGNSIIREGVNNTRDSHSIISRLVVPTNQSRDSKSISCTTKFRLQEKPSDTTADNIPTYNYTWIYTGVSRRHDDNIPTYNHTWKYTGVSAPPEKEQVSTIPGIVAASVGAAVIVLIAAAVVLGLSRHRKKKASNLQKPSWL